MTQYVINIGAIPNDGTGDPLRTAFNETNLNFDQVFAAGPVLSNIQIANNKILTTNTNGNLVLAPNGTGVVQSNVSIVPNLANLRNLGSSTQRWATVYTQYLNATQINLAGDLTVAGNLTVQGNIIQIGNIVTDSLTIQLANTATTANAAGGAGITVGANDDIATFLYRANGNVWATNIGLQVAGQANVLSLSVNQTANAWRINGNTITAPSGAFWQSDPAFQDEYITSAVNGYINLTSRYANGNTASQVHLEHGLAQIVVDNGAEYIWDFDDTGNLTLPSNVASINYANGTSILGGIGGNYGNSNVATFLAGFGSNTISTTGNITSNYYVGNVTVLAGQNARGEHAANLGSAGFTELNSNVILQITGNANSYAQINFQNIGNGTAATTDYIATAQFGTDSTYFVDMGIASGTYDSSSPDNSLGNSLYAQDSYLYAMGGNSYGGSGGNLVVGSNEPGGVVRIIADGSTTDNIVATFSNIGVDVKGNIVPGTSNVYSLGNATNQWNDLYVSNATIFMNNVPVSLTAGNVLTVNGNAVLQNDSNTSIATTGTITANVFATATSNLTIGPIDLVLPDPYTYIRQSTANGGLQVGWDGQPDNDGIAYITFNDPSEASITLWTGNANTIAHQWSFLNDGTFIGYGNIDFAGNAFLGNIETFDISAVGNITGNYFFGNGSQLTGISTGVQSSIANGTSNVSIATANGNATITANAVTYTFGTNSTLTLPGGSRLRPLGANLDIFAGDGSYVNLITSDESSYLGVDGSGGYITTAGGTWNFNTNGNLTAPGNVSATGNVTGGNIVTSGSGGDITMSSGNITGANVVSANTFVSNAFNVVTAGNLSITSQYGLGFTGTILEDNGTLELIANGSGCVVVGWDSTYGNGLGNIATVNFNEVGGGEGNILLRTGNRSATEYNWNFDSTGNLTLPGGMIINGNINTLGTQTALLQPTDNLPLSFIASGANGTVTSFWAEDFANLMTSNIAAVYTPLQNTQTVRIVTGSNGGNIAIYDFDKDGVFSTAQVSATGNITGNYFIGNGSQLTGIAASYGNSNVATFLAGFGSNTVSTTGNITTGNLLTGGLISATGNVTAAGTGTNMVRRAYTVAGSNTKVTLDNITAQVGGTPTRLYIGTATSNLTVAGDSQTLTSGSTAVSSWINVPIVTGTGNEFAMSGALTNNGDTAILSMIDQGTGTGMWRITGMIANTTANLYGITIERLA